MSVNPLDLQAIFSQMNQVGKQQALNKESQVIRQDHASEQVQKDGEKDAEDIPDTKDLSEGPGKIKDEEKGKKFSNKKEEEEKDKEEKKDKKNAKKTEDLDMKDPNLGQNIDIIG